MDFIMRVWKKSERTSGRHLISILLVAALITLPASGQPETQGINVRFVTGTMIDNNYLINANIDYHFSAESRNALVHGVPLQFATSIAVKIQRRWLWDRTINEILLKYKIQYHPLSGFYLITNLNDGGRRQFMELDDATDYMGKLKNYPLSSRSALADNNGDYYGIISARLDIQSLPAPLRPQAYLSSQWRLSSPEYIWSIQP